MVGNVVAVGLGGRRDMYGNGMRKVNLRRITFSVYSRYPSWAFPAGEKLAGISPWTREKRTVPLTMEHDSDVF